jgi:hypothetical protein
MQPSHAAADLQEMCFQWFTAAAAAAGFVYGTLWSD